MFNPLNLSPKGIVIGTPQQEVRYYSTRRFQVHNNARCRYAGRIVRLITNGRYTSIPGTSEATQQASVTAEEYLVGKTVYQISNTDVVGWSEIDPIE